MHSNYAQAYVIWLCLCSREPFLGFLACACVPPVEVLPTRHFECLTHRIHGAALYGNIYHQYTPNVSIYISAPWILWVMGTEWIKLVPKGALGSAICMCALARTCRNKESGLAKAVSAASTWQRTLSRWSKSSSNINTGRSPCRLYKAIERTTLQQWWDTSFLQRWELWVQTCCLA